MTTVKIERGVAANKWPALLFICIFFSDKSSQLVTING